MDDEPYALHALRRALHHSGHWVVTAGSGAEGLQMQRAALAEADPFAAVVSDLLMPEMDGIEFLTASCGLDPVAARILLTGVPDLATSGKARQAHILRILSKPVTPPDLSRILDDALR